MTPYNISPTSPALRKIIEKASSRLMPEADLEERWPGGGVRRPAGPHQVNSPRLRHLDHRVDQGPTFVLKGPGQVPDEPHLPGRDQLFPGRPAVQQLPEYNTVPEREKTETKTDGQCACA